MTRYEPMPGENIRETARRMVAMAKKSKDTVKAAFNEIALTATENSDVDLIVKFYDDESQRRSEAYRNSPEGKEAERRAEEFRKKAEAARAEGILPFKVRDAESWQKSVGNKDNNKDGYGSGVIRYAARWANLMEKKMSAGAKLEDIADSTSHEADAEGITGFMYGCAVSMLSQEWEHGEQLRRWHNLSIQIRNEGEKANESGGVLNPALLSVGPS